jgi:small GTP-binding protein
MEPEVKEQLNSLIATPFVSGGADPNESVNAEALDAMKHDAVWKVIIIGDTGVGKSCMISKLIQNVFKGEHNVTIGVEFGNYGMVIRKEDGSESLIKLQIWDTAGQESFRSITRIFYKGSQAIIVVFDITSRESFESVRTWQGEIENNADEDVLIYLVGNFADQLDSRAVS